MLRWSNICVKNICKYLTVLLLFHHQIRNLLPGMKIYMQTYQLCITIMEIFSWSQTHSQFILRKHWTKKSRNIWCLKRLLSRSMFVQTKTLVADSQFPVVCQYWPIYTGVTESNTNLLKISMKHISHEIFDIISTDANRK